MISAFYFADTMLRASLKTFWFDELLTLYLSRLPSFHDTWTAAERGVDFNTPLFFLICRGARHLFGEGLIATRLPAMLGFWIFGLCLYTFASRRLGRLVGLVAALAPIFTLAHNYAYEARAYGIILAWCGLMMVCWQRSREQPIQEMWQTSAWTVGLGLCYLGALFSHVYAVYLAAPFLLVEALAIVRRRRVSWLTCAALLAAIAIVTPLYLRMIGAFRTMIAGGGLPLHNFILAIYGPSLVLMLLAVAVTVIGRRPTENLAETAARGLTTDESTLVYALFLLPIIGGIGVQLSHGPYFDRYFVACTAGFGLLFAQQFAGKSARQARRVLALMLLLILADLSLAIRAWRGADLVQIEPASHFRFSASPSRPLERDTALSLDSSNLDVLVIQDHNYLYLFSYAPEALRRRLVFGAPDAQDFFLLSYRILQTSAKVNLRTTTYAEFFATHRDFLVYGSNTGAFNGGCGDCLQPFLDAGYTLRSVQRDSDSLLEHFVK